MMRVGCILMMLGAAAAQTDAPYGNEEWRTFDKMCGQLVQTEPVVSSKNGKSEEKKNRSRKLRSCCTREAVRQNAVKDCRLQHAR